MLSLINNSSSHSALTILNSTSRCLKCLVQNHALLLKRKPLYMHLSLPRSSLTTESAENQPFQATAATEMVHKIRVVPVFGCERTLSCKFNDIKNWYVGIDTRSGNQQNHVPLATRFWVCLEYNGFEHLHMNALRKIKYLSEWHNISPTYTNQVYEFIFFNPKNKHPTFLDANLIHLMYLSKRSRSTSWVILIEAFLKSTKTLNIADTVAGNCMKLLDFPSMLDYPIDRGIDF